MIYPDYDSYNKDSKTNESKRKQEDDEKLKSERIKYLFKCAGLGIIGALCATATVEFVKSVQKVYDNLQREEVQQEIRVDINGDGVKEKIKGTFQIYYQQPNGSYNVQPHKFEKNPTVQKNSLEKKARNE